MGMFTRLIKKNINRQTLEKIRCYFEKAVYISILVGFAALRDWKNGRVHIYHG